MNNDFDNFGGFDSFGAGGADPFEHSFPTPSVHDDVHADWQAAPDPFIESYNLGTSDPTAIAIRLAREAQESDMALLRESGRWEGSDAWVSAVQHGTPAREFFASSWDAMSDAERHHWECAEAETAAALEVAAKVLSELTDGLVDDLVLAGTTLAAHFGETNWAAVPEPDRARWEEYWLRVDQADDFRFDDAVHRWVDHVTGRDDNDEEDEADWNRFVGKDTSHPAYFASRLSQALARQLGYVGARDADGWRRPTDTEWAHLPTGHMHRYNRAYASFAGLVGKALPADREVPGPEADAHEDMLRSGALEAARERHQAARPALRIIREPESLQAMLRAKLDR